MWVDKLFASQTPFWLGGGGKRKTPESTYTKDIGLTQKLSLILSLTGKCVLSDLSSLYHPSSPLEEMALSEPQHITEKKNAAFFQPLSAVYPLYVVLPVPEGMLYTLTRGHRVQI